MAVVGELQWWRSPSSCSIWYCNHSAAPQQGLMAVVEGGLGGTGRHRRCPTSQYLRPTSLAWACSWCVVPIPSSSQSRFAAAAVFVFPVLAGCGLRHCHALVVMVVSPSSSSQLHPVLTPRAVAHSGSWGCCRDGGPRRPGGVPDPCRPSSSSCIGPIVPFPAHERGSRP